MKLYIGQQMVLPSLQSVCLGKTRSEAAATLTAVLLTAPADTFFIKLSVALGDPVRLLDDAGQELFLGSIHEMERTPERVSLTAYDRGVCLTRNELYGVFSGTGREIAAQVAGKLGIPLGETEAVTPRQIIVAGAGRSAFSILRQAVGEDAEISLQNGALTVKKQSQAAHALSAQNLLDVSCRASIRHMVNRSVVVGRNGRLLSTAESKDDSAAFGQFQQVIGKNGNAEEQARAALRRKTLSARVTLLGDLTFQSGGSAELHHPQWGLEGLYIITAAEHRWEKGVFTTSLSLEAAE